MVSNKNRKPKKRQSAKRPFDADRVLGLLRNLAEEEAILLENSSDLKSFLNSHSEGIGYSQFNELLLALGYDKICPQFFDFLCVGALNPKANSSLRDSDHLEEAVDRFRK